MPRPAFFLMSLLLVTATALPVSANPGVRCAAHNDVVERLSQIYGERRQAIGLATGSSVMEVYASDESGSWSITVTQPGGPTCLVASGQGFRLELPKVIEDPDA